jgi:anti-anti-sigma regulatory factor
MLAFPQRAESEMSRAFDFPGSSGVGSLMCGEGVFIVPVSGDLEDIHDSFEHVVSSLVTRGADHIILDLRHVTSVGPAAVTTLRKLTSAPRPSYWVAPSPVVAGVTAALGLETVPTPYRAVSLIRSGHDAPN